MKKFLLGGIALIALVGAAAAADMPTRMPTKAAPNYVSAYDWTGFYLGIQGGYGSGRPDYNVPSTGFDHSWSATGGFGGVFGGYNYQFNNNFVVGIQGEYNFASITGSEINTFGNNQYSSLKGFGSIDGRLGFAWDRALLYAIGGVAFGNPSQTFTIGTAGASTTFSGGNNTGWDLGAGLEYAFLGNWTVRAEYRYYSFGNVTVQPDGVVLGLAHTQKETVNTVRLGVAYKF
jgi:outer membrane immunogenic protein